MNWLQLAITLEPLVATVVKDLSALFKAHPELTQEQIAFIVSAVHGKNAETLAVIEADQAAAHP
jgi:hypothetical protein